MKQMKKLLALLLALSMTLSLCVPAVLAAEEDAAAVTEAYSDTQEDAAAISEAAAKADEAQPEAAQDTPEADKTEDEPSQPTTDGENSQPTTDGESSQTAAESEPSQPEAESSGDASASAEAPADASEAEPELEAQAAGELTIAEEVLDLSLDYDDRYTFTSLKQGYVVAQITDQDPTSYVVNKGAVTSNWDSDVLTLEKDSNVKVTAVGTGTAKVLLVKEEDLDAAKALLDKSQSATQSVEAVQVNVTVHPARLTLMFLAGQSNMEGYGSYSGSGSKQQKLYQKPEQSVVCPEGEVYSTYAPSESAYKNSRANSIGGGVKFNGPCTPSDATAFVAGSLTGTRNQEGTKLTYPLNQMTSAGDGKNGMDSGLAWEWNRLTGDKVWTVNAGWGGTVSAWWVPGGKCYKKAAAVFKAALKTYNAEIKAGHYVAGEKLCFWLQGESDGQENVSASKYLSNFQKMHDGLKDVCGFSEMGIISVRASLGGHYKDKRDIKMTGPRLAQTYMANTKSYSDIHMVSDVNELWVSDGGVKNYFSKTYGSSFDYKTHGSTPSLPTKVSHVHNDIHFSQLAHNENGITAAKGMYLVIKGGKGEKYSVKWRDKNGLGVSSLTLQVGESTFLSPTVDPVGGSKLCSWKVSKGLSYAGKSATLKATAAGVQTFTVVSPDGQTIGALTVKVTPQKPTISKAANVKGGKLNLQWTKSTSAQGYQIQYATNSSFLNPSTTLVEGVNTRSATLTGLKKKKTYYVRVRSWAETDGKVYSKWSSTKTVKISK